MTARDDLSIYGGATDWWGGGTRWVRTLKNLTPARFAFFDPIIGDWRGRKVLDLGCGGGFMAEALAERGAAVSGIDPSSAAIEAARRRASATGSTIDYRVGSGEHLPFADGAFDIVVCVDVLEHVDDLRQTLLEIRRVLRPGGIFLFDTINRTWIASLVMITIGERILLPRGAHDAARFIRPLELRQALEATGFDVGPFAGMGPRGLDRRLDFTFGFMPTMAIQYLGLATARARRPATGRHCEP